MRSVTPCRRRARPARRWYATYVAAVAARAHGRREPALLAELEALVAEAEQTYDIPYGLLAPARLNRAWVLMDVARAAEAEAEVRDVLTDDRSPAACERYVCALLSRITPSRSSASGVRPADSVGGGPDGGTCVAGEVNVWSSYSRNG
ncbi:hypothetical protein [Streptomyces sp. NPDC093225]|uniref:hypothetical protein n=1 Tax=Streptomyces sp. NPDC093225 TaxID=3366034 RepID=UPI0037FB9889